MSIQKIEISTSTIFKTAGIFLLFYFIYFFKSLVLVLFISFIISAVIDRFVNFFKRFKIPKMLTIIFCYLFFLFIFFFCIYAVLPNLIDYVFNSFKELPNLLDSFKKFNNNHSSYDSILGNFSHFLQNIKTDDVYLKIKNWLFTFSAENTKSFFNFLVYFVLTIIISFYISISKDGVKSFVKLISPKKYENYVLHLLERTERKISGWFFGIIIVAFIVSTLVYLILTIFNIPFALSIAIIAFFFEIIPVLGVTSAAVPALFLAYNVGGITLSIIILVSFFLISQLSSYFLYPKIVGRIVGIPTVIIIIAIFIGAEIGGFWGALIAIPLSTILMEIVEDFQIFKNKENPNIKLSN